MNRIHVLIIVLALTFIYTETARASDCTTDNCLPRDITLAGTAIADHPDIRKAREQLAAGDATGAKITLKVLLESATPGRPLARLAQRMLDRDVALAQALEHARAGDLFLIEGTLKKIDRQLGKTPADQATRKRIAEIRHEVAAQKIRLASEGHIIAIAVRHLLETEKLFRGDYPLWREDAEKIIKPALVYAGDTFVMTKWQPTLRGYKLWLQDKRTGSTIEVSPE